MPTGDLFGPLRAIARAFYRTAPTEELLRRYALDRDGEAFTAIVERFRGLVLRRCKEILPCDYEAQDAAQETFVELAQNFHRVLGPGALIGWLNKVARNKAFDIRRRERRKRRLVAHAMRNDPGVSAETSFGRLAHDEMVEQVNEALRQLPQKYRQVLELCFLDGLTQKEAAAILGRPVGTVAWRVQAGLERLKVLLVRRGLGLVTIGALSGVLAEQSKAALPAAARLLADAALTAAGSGRTTFKLGLIGLATWKAAAAVALVAVVFCGAVAWWLNVALNGSTTEAPKAPNQAIASETLQETNLRILDRQVIPKIVEALRPQTLGTGEVVILSRTANDHRVGCEIEVRQSVGKKGTKYSFCYDPLGGVLGFGVDLFGTGHFKSIDPTRPIAVVNPLTGKEVIIRVGGTVDIVRAFQAMPVDERALAERTHLWEERMRELGRDDLFPGPVAAMAGNSKLLYLTTGGDTDWLWAGSLTGPNRNWHCIDQGGGHYLAANEEFLFTCRGGRILKRPVDAIGLRWEPVCSLPADAASIAATSQQLFYLNTGVDLYARSILDEVGPWIWVGRPPREAVFAFGETLYSIGSEGTWTRMASLAPATWTKGTRISRRTSFAAGGRMWRCGTWTKAVWNSHEGCWSCPMTGEKESWRFEGPLARVLGR
jgi:RNA polymerase sigma factor (sigma-70 family)